MGGGSVSVTAATGNIIVNPTPGTGTFTLDVNTGTTANKIVKLDGSAKLPAVDGSQLTNLPGIGSGSYIVTGGTTARIDANRWVDGGINAIDAGIDCTGATDSTTAFQAAIDAMPTGGGGIIWFPNTCNMHISTTINVRSRRGVQFLSTSKSGGSGGCEGPVPTITWTGGSGPVIDFEYADNPVVQGISFVITGTANTILNYDGDGGSNPNLVTGTHGYIQDSCFYNYGGNNANFNAIYIAPTTNANQENFVVSNISVFCSNSRAQELSHVAVISTSTALTSADANFVSGDVGKVIWITYPDYFQKTTIASVTNSTTIVLAATTTISQTAVTIHTGTAYGVGVHVGHSQNSIQHKFWNVGTNGCDKSVWLEGGGADIRHVSGGFGNYGIKIDYAIQNTAIDFYESEFDARGIEAIGSSAILITNSRLQNSNQFADGFLKLSSAILEASSLSYTPAAGSVLIGNYQNYTPIISIGNAFVDGVGHALTWTQIGYALFATDGAPVTTIGDAFDQTTGSPTNFGTFSNAVGAYPTVTITGNFGHEFGVALGLNANNYFNDGSYTMAPLNMKNLPTSCTGLATGTIWNNTNVLNVCP